MAERVASEATNSRSLLMSATLYDRENIHNAAARVRPVEPKPLLGSLTLCGFPMQFHPKRVGLER
jgi:hypothetical protein